MKHGHRRVWVVLGWDRLRSGVYVFSSTPEQRWHWTRKSALVELKSARARYTDTNWKIIRMVPMVGQ